MRDQQYLGDSVYAGMDDDGGNNMALYLDNGTGPHTIIYLEPETCMALLWYAQRMWPNLKWLKD